MNKILFIHPVGQFFAFLCGVFNVVTGYSRKGFNMSVHINLGAIYYFCSLIGAGAGLIVSKLAEKSNVIFDMEFHEFNSIILIVLFGIGAYTGLSIVVNRAKRTNLLKYHKWANVLGILLFLIQGITGIKALIEVI
jgi:hypothetical protein